MVGLPAHISIMEFITNKKGGQSLVWDGCRFTLNRNLDTGTCYSRCHKRSCAARLTPLGTDILKMDAGDQSVQ